MNSTIDYLGYILFRLFAPFIRALPINFALFLGRRLGDLFFYFDAKHKSIAYANIKTAMRDNLSPYGLTCITREFYQRFGQNIMEVFFIPVINKAYINKYVEIEGYEHISEGLKKGKGVIFLVVHEGSWELSNIICANLELNFAVVVRGQRLSRLNKLLNSYRSAKGCKVIDRQSQTRQLIEMLKNNGAVAITADQGGKTGTHVKFFGKEASMSSGALRLALKYGAALIPTYFVRIKGPKVKVIVEPPFTIKQTGDLDSDIHHYLQEIVHIFEKYIKRYPQEYLWTYKIWKYGQEKNILILDDGKVGHLRQAQSLANIARQYLKERGINVRLHTVEIKFKSGLANTALAFSSLLAGKYHCQGCLWCLRTFLRDEVYKNLIASRPDVVISCGSSVAPINYVLSRENLARSVVIMRPSLLSVNRFNLVIMPRHDNPPRRKNIVVTDGALNLIDDEYLAEKSRDLIQASGGRLQASSFYFGLLLGGDTKNFKLKADVMLEVARQIKSAAEKFNAGILVTTSRRTSKETEELVKREFGDYRNCKLLIIANEKNIPEAVGGILGLSKVVVVSPESISMVSEAASSGRHTLAFEAEVSPKHRNFLNHLSRNGYIHFIQAEKIADSIARISSERSPAKVLRDGDKVREALGRII